MQISIKLLPIDDRTSGFEMGDITLEHQGKTITSAGRTPSQSMMIFIFMSDFIEMLIALEKNGRPDLIKLIAADSSFSLSLKKDGPNLTISEQSTKMIVPLQDFLRTVRSSTLQWLAPLKSKIDSDDPALNDLLSALKKMETVF
jgi:hypothetical protein